MTDDNRKLSSTEIEDMTRGMKRLHNASYYVFFSSYYNRLWAYLVVVSNGNAEDIEEVLQITFEKVVKHIKVFRQEHEFWAWLCTISRNSYLDSLRKRKRSLRAFEMLSDYLSLFSSPEEKIDDTDSTLINRALQELEPTERILIEQKYYQGNNHLEIGASLGITEKAVESKLARIRKKLRRKLILSEENE